jgi:MFS family permease
MTVWVVSPAVGEPFIAATARPTVPGTLLEWFSWRSAFAVNVVLAVIAIAGTIGFVPESSHPDAPPPGRWAAPGYRSR